MGQSWQQLAAQGGSAVFRKTVAESDVHIFAGITGDFFGVHTDETYARQTQFGRRIAHGAYTVGLVSAAVSRLGDASVLPGGINVKFRAPVFIGDTLAAEVQTMGAGEAGDLLARARVVNQEDVVVAEGSVTLLRVEVEER